MQADAWVVYITRDGQNHIDNACTVILAENSLNIWSNTVYIYGSGQPYVMKCACWCKLINNQRLRKLSRSSIPSADARLVKLVSHSLSLTVSLQHLLSIPSASLSQPSINSAYTQQSSIPLTVSLQHPLSNPLSWRTTWMLICQPNRWNAAFSWTARAKLTRGIAVDRNCDH